jgi:hypothetical protein
VPRNEWVRRNDPVAERGVAHEAIQVASTTVGDHRGQDILGVVARRRQR